MKLLVTGSSRGLGKAFVDYYQNKGAEAIYGLGRSELESPAYHYLTVDISDFDALQSGLGRLLLGVEHLDLVVLNAGILGRITDTSRCAMESLKKQMDVNMWANKVILDFLIEHRIAVKQVIAISSGASLSGSLGWNGYSLSKAALNMLVKLYAAEMPHTHLVALAPGLVETSMLDSIIYGDHDTKRYDSVERLRQSQHNGLVQTPQETVERIVSSLDDLRNEPSGAYVDIRNFEPGTV